MATVNAALGEHEKSKVLYQSVLGVQEKQYGQWYPEIATTLSNLAMVRYTKKFLVKLGVVVGFYFTRHEITEPFKSRDSILPYRLKFARLKRARFGPKCA